MTKVDIHNMTHNGRPNIDRNPPGNRPRPSPQDDGGEVGGYVPYYKVDCNNYPGNKCGRSSGPEDSQAVMNYNAMNPIKLITITIILLLFIRMFQKNHHL
jgi:hypothetical protein